MKTITSLACGLLLLLQCQLSASTHVPPFFDDLLKRCDVKDQDSMDSCLYLVLDSMRPYLPDGIPEWSIPSLEPLAIQGITMNQGGGNTRIRATFKDLAVSGLSNYTISYVKSDPAQYKFSVGLLFPTLHIAGNYNILGNLLLIPIKGQGPFKAEFKSVTADSYNWLDVVHPAGPAAPGRLLLSHTQTDFDIGKVNLRLENLFNNDDFLGETVNTFLNENAQDIIREVKPQFAQEIDRLVLSVFSRAVAALPVELWEGLAKKLVDPTDPEQAKKLMALASSSKIRPKEDKKSWIEVHDSAEKEDKKKSAVQVKEPKHVKKQLEPNVKEKSEPKKPEAVTFKDHSKVSA